MTPEFYEAFGIYIEIFGYIGTALVLLSMMMTQVAKLRMVNIAGSVVSMTYAAICSTWPVVFLNFGLIIINSIQLIRLQRLKSFFKVVRVDASDKCVEYLLEHYSSDIKQYFSETKTGTSDSSAVFVVFDGAEAVGILAGDLKDGELRVTLDYFSRKYRDGSVAKILYEKLCESGVERIVATAQTEKHRKYLFKMDFKDSGDTLVKSL